MNDAVTDRDGHDAAESVSLRVAEELYPLAVKQARSQVMIQLVVLSALVALVAITGFQRSMAFAAAMIATGAVATAIDIRWWLWVRRAEPVDVYRLSQMREHSESAIRSPLTLTINVVVAVLWLIVAR
jgi:hypothetical protein